MSPMVVKTLIASEPVFEECIVFSDVTLLPGFVTTKGCGRLPFFVGTPMTAALVTPG